MIVITGIIAVLLLIAYTMYQKIRRGGSCCGEHEAEAARVSPADRDLSHYSFIYCACVEGMVCSRCVRNVENAFNSQEGMSAKAYLGAKTVTIYSKKPLDRREAAAIIDNAGYTLTDFKEDKK